MGIIERIKREKPEHLCPCGSGELYDLDIGDRKTCPKCRVYKKPAKWTDPDKAYRWRQNKKR